MPHAPPVQARLDDALRAYRSSLGDYEEAYSLYQRLSARVRDMEEWHGRLAAAWAAANRTAAATGKEIDIEAARTAGRDYLSAHRAYKEAWTHHRAAGAALSGRELRLHSERRRLEASGAPAFELGPRPSMFVRRIRESPDFPLPLLVPLPFGAPFVPALEFPVPAGLFPPPRTEPGSATGTPRPGLPAWFRWLPGLLAYGRTPAPGLRGSALAADDRPFTLDRASAESALNAGAIIDAHLESARLADVAFPAESQEAGLKDAIIFWKDQFAKVKADFDRVRRTAVETYRDGKPRDIRLSDWDMLNTLDASSAAVEEVALGVCVAKGAGRQDCKAKALYPQTIAGTWPQELPGLPAAAIVVGGLTVLGAVAWAVWG